MAPLILRLTAALRGLWRGRDDHYDVVENGVMVGRIFRSPSAPKHRPWMWASGRNGDIKRAALDTSRRARRR